MRIALDAWGGDDAPAPNIDGALQALARNPQLEIALVGDRAELERLLDGRSFDASRLQIVPSEGVVGMEEKPTRALRQKPNNSIAVCWKLMASRDVDAVVSAGNTGAVVAAGLRTRLFLKNVKRPGIAVPLPTARGRSVLVDVGANPAARPEHLLQYGLMGSIYAREVLEIAQPAVGLMNIGTEEGKGNELYREAHAMLANCPLGDRYVGNVEGRGLFLGAADVLVCEGFVGNVVLKVSEGFASFLMKSVSEGLLSRLEGQRDSVAAALEELGKSYEYRESGGAPLLGIDGICIICHGSSDSHSMANALELATTFRERRVNALIAEELAESAATAS